ncbi:hypothetical protein [Burkholderia plantarii]|uniref:hypothetical protein n=1 Tax=Burkholderia plantarii TaxID=41899 RepID=UPI00272D8ED1|nr:hypothetical protein [Burkholderia plantarii]
MVIVEVILRLVPSGFIQSCLSHRCKSIQDVRDTLARASVFLRRMRMRAGGTHAMLLGFCLLGMPFAQGQAHASALTVTATYKGSLTSTGGQFTNTTPQSGICVDRPGMCPKGYFSILFPWAGNQGKNVGAYAIFHGVPAQFWDDSVNMAIYAYDRTVPVYDDHGMARTVVLKVDAIGFLNNPESGDVYSAYTRPNGTNCRGISWRGTSEGGAYAIWTGTNPGYTLCWIGPPRGQETVTMGYVSFRYLLKLDKPWTWPPGIYRGTYLYGYGSGRDLYFGPNFSGSVDDVSLNFVLTVLPDMYVHFPGDHGGVVGAELAPPGGWSDWQGRMPPSLTAEVPFDFATLGPVRISLQCQNPAGDTCGIVDLAGGAPLAVDALLTDNHLNDDSGRVAVDSRLTTTARVFTPLVAQPVGVVPARLTFRTQPGATQQMQAGHQYGGLVTVVFDSSVN